MTMFPIPPKPEPQRPGDEFQSPRERKAAWSTMFGYCLSRDAGGLARLISDDMHRRNVFGTYPGTLADHARDIIEAARCLPSVDGVDMPIPAQTDKPSPAPSPRRECRSCMYFVAGAEEARGWCRRYPPVARLSGECGERPRASYEFPDTSALSWCGEYATDEKFVVKYYDGPTSPQFREGNW